MRGLIPHLPHSTRKLSKVDFYHWCGAGHIAIGFQMSYERQEPVRLRSPFRYCWVLHSDQKHFWLSPPHPIRQCSVHSSVFWPCKTSITLASALSLVPLLVCPQIISSLPLSLSLSLLMSSQFLTDTSCSHCLPLMISSSSLTSKSASPTLLSISFFLLSALVATFLGWHCQSWFPKLPVLLPSPQLLCWISWHFPDCLSLSGHLLPSALQSAFSHLLTPLTGGQGINVLRCPDLQHAPIAGFYSKDSNRCLLDRESIMPFTEFLLLMQSM